MAGERVKSLLLFATAALLVSASPSGAEAQRISGQGPGSRWRTTVLVCRLDARPADAGAPSAAQGRTCLAPELRALVLPSDVPADLRRRRLEGASLVTVEVAASGQPQACRVAQSSGEARLDRIACDMIVRRGRFRPFYSAPARAIPWRLDAGVQWEISDVPPLPMIVPSPPQVGPIDTARPGSWPRLSWWNAFELAGLPRIQPLFPTEARRDGVVSLDLIVTPERGIEGCVIGVSTGDAALDSAACRAARSVELRYPRPCQNCASGVVPLQVIWRRGGGSHIRFPLPWTTRPGGGPTPIKDPADTRTALTSTPRAVPLPLAVSSSDYRGVRDGAVTNGRYVAAVLADAAGQITDCRTARSSGNEPVDRRTCDLILRRGRVAPRTDVFGDPIPSPDQIAFPVDLSGIG